LNCVGASRDIAETDRFYLTFTGRSRTGFIVCMPPRTRASAQVMSPDEPINSTPISEARRRGRPKGSKNKPKVVATESAPQRRGRQRQPQPDLLDYRPQAGPSPSDQDLARYLEPEADTAGDSRKEEIAKAVAFLRAAGYRVIKPRTSKIRKPKDRVGPTFAPEFSDAVPLRMATFTSMEKLDWGRGERLAQAAWQSRWRTAHAQYSEQNGKRYGKRCLIDVIAPVPPAIVSAHFEQDGKVLAQRGQAPQSKPASV